MSDDRFMPRDTAADSICTLLERVEDPPQRPSLAASRGIDDRHGQLVAAQAFECTGLESLARHRGVLPVP